MAEGKFKPTLIWLVQCGGSINCPAVIADTSLCGDSKAPQC